MRKVRLVLSASMIALMGISAVTLSSCSKDDDCQAGYTGKNCEDEIRTPMLGTYEATDVNTEKSSDVNVYNPTITKNSGNVAKVNITTFGNFYKSDLVVSDVQENGKDISFTIPAQTPDGRYEVSGSGKFDTKAKEITISYLIHDSEGGVDDLSYTGTWTMK